MPLVNGGDSQRDCLGCRPNRGVETEAENLCLVAGKPGAPNEEILLQVSEHRLMSLLLNHFVV